MITTGKNLGSIIGDFGQFISEQNPSYDDDGFLKDKLFVMANPKYGSEKKGLPTTYYLTVAPSHIRTHSELQHVEFIPLNDVNAFNLGNPRSTVTIYQLARDIVRLEEQLADLLTAQVEVRVKKRIKRHGKVEDAGEVAIQFGSLEELNGLIDKLRNA